MRKVITDSWLVIGFLIAHFLLYFTFEHEKVFWYMFTASMLILISFSILKEEIEDKAPLKIYLPYGLLTGFCLFVLFWIGYLFLTLLKIPVQDDISRLYTLFSPSLFWQFLALMLIAVPGEEIFWRGFILKRLVTHTNSWIGVVLSSIMYGSIHIYTGEWILVFAAFVSGCAWGLLYVWKRSIPLVLVSHLVFSLFLFILFPLT